MIGAAIALIVVGILLGSFVAFPFGYAIAVVGLVLLVLFLLGFGRRAASSGP
jgi:hypothetical protein